MQHRWDVISISASSRISEERKVDPAVKSACVLTFVVIVNRLPSSETAGSKLALPESACKPGCAEAEGSVFGFDLVCWSLLDRICF